MDPLSMEKAMFKIMVEKTGRSINKQLHIMYSLLYLAPLTEDSNNE